MLALAQLFLWATLSQLLFLLLCFELVLDCKSLWLGTNSVIMARDHAIQPMPIHPKSTAVVMAVAVTAASLRLFVRGFYHWSKQHALKHTRAKVTTRAV